MLVALQLVGVGVVLVPAKDTVLVPCVAPKVTPEIVTEVPTVPAVFASYLHDGLQSYLQQCGWTTVSADCATSLTQHDAFVDSDEEAVGSASAGSVRFRIMVYD
jgi:hypothetical protein